MSGSYTRIRSEDEEEVQVIKGEITAVGEKTRREKFVVSICCLVFDLTHYHPTM